MKGEVPCNKLV